MLEVISSERKDNKKGKWLVLVCKNEKGQDRTYNIFDNDDAGKKIINESFKGPGKYDEKTVKDGQYWKLVQLDLLGQATAPAAAPAPHGAPAPAPVASPKSARVEIAQGCVLAAARVYDGAMGRNGESPAEQVNQDVVNLARKLMDECAAFINGATKTPEGA